MTPSTIQPQKKIPSNLLCIFMSLISSLAFATPPIGDPNQPYDRLPGTLETEHVKWAKPRAAGPLKVLFIIPYFNSREVVEAAQRLDMTYTVIMNAGYATWEEGDFQGAIATPLKEGEAVKVLTDLTKERLDLEREYDAIVIAKISWPAIPEYAQDLILKHVERGTGLVYVTPNRLKPGIHSRVKLTDIDQKFLGLFETNTINGAATAITRGLPMDSLPFHLVTKHLDYKPIPNVSRASWMQTPLCITATNHGKGRIVGLDYFDEAIAYRKNNSLSPYLGHPQSIKGVGEEFPSNYDFSYALLSRALLWSADQEPEASLSATITARKTELTAPTDEKRNRLGFENKTPAVVAERKYLGTKDNVAVVAIKNIKLGDFSFELQIRDTTGRVIHTKSKEGGDGSASMILPKLPRGTYFFDARAINKQRSIIDFASVAFRIEDPQSISAVTTTKDAYASGETVSGKIRFAQPLVDEEKATVIAVDTWGRTVANAKIAMADDRRHATFEFPVHNPLTRLWDIEATITDTAGEIDTKRTWIGLPDWTFDDYMMMLIFAPSPAVNDWKGLLWGKVMREYGINSTFTHLIYNNIKQYEVNERAHLMSVSYAEHMGEHWTPADAKRDKRKKQHDLDLAALSIMCREIARTGKPIDPKKFPYKQGHIDANWLNTRLASYKESARFGSPLYVLTGENYLIGEFDGMEASGFGPVTTKAFQAWCRKQFDDDLSALNKEWNTSFRSWDEVCGIMLQAAVEQDQMPRWVDFRYFMRSHVWTQFFMDYTDMIRTVVPEARTGRVGHDHFDFSRMRKHMASSKLYIGQERNSEWRHAMMAELLQSFSQDDTFLLASQSMMRWHYDHNTAVTRERWPWLCLFIGMRGFDWERGLLVESLGGESCMTPCMSDPLPYFEEIADEVRILQSGIGKLAITAKPHRSRVAILWSPYNHYISRLHPFQENAFSGTWLYNISVTGGAPSDALALMNSLRMRPTMVGPQDVVAGDLEKRGFSTLILPYSKGLSIAEANAIRAFVNQGGLVIADNHPGVATEHGRTLKKPRLADLFPVTDKINIVKHGKGHAAYLPNIINGYLGRHEKADYTGSDAVEQLLVEYTKETPPVELLDEKGLARRDTLMPVFRNGATTLVGLLRCADGQHETRQATTMVLTEKSHVWDIRKHAYLGHRDRVALTIDLRPQFLAILPANPGKITLTAAKQVRAGDDLVLPGAIAFTGNGKNVSHALHVRVHSADGKELEWFRQNKITRGAKFEITLPIALSAKPEHYRITVEHAITGETATAKFEIVR